MKNKTLPSLITSLYLLLAACGPSTEKTDIETKPNDKNETAQVEVADEDKISENYAISGMVCEFGCAKFIEEEVSSHGGVLDFKVDFKNETAEIIFDKSRTSSSEIMALVGGLNDGQYSMTEISSEAEGSSIEENPSKNSVDSTSFGGNAQISIPRMENFKFSFPKVITYFMRRL